MTRARDTADIVADVAVLHDKPLYSGKVTNIVNTIAQQYLFTTIYDTHSAMDGSGNYTIPKTGYYKINRHEVHVHANTVDGAVNCVSTTSLAGTEVMRISSQQLKAQGQGQYNMAADCIIYATQGQVLTTESVFAYTSVYINASSSFLGSMLNIEYIGE